MTTLEPEGSEPKREEFRERPKVEKPEGATADVTADASSDLTLTREDWNKERQRADQERANRERVSAEKEAIESEYKTATQRIEQLEAMIEKNQAKIDDLDPNTADIPDLVKHNAKLQEKLTEQQSTINDLVNRATAFQERIDLEEREKQRASTIESILKPLDEEYGAKFRTAAKKLADKMVADGMDPPGDKLEAYLLMRKCYNQVHQEETARTAKETVRGDDGSGGFAFGLSEYQEGSLNEVLGDMKKRGLVR